MKKLLALLLAMSMLLALAACGNDEDTNDDSTPASSSTSESTGTSNSTENSNDSTDSNQDNTQDSTDNTTDGDTSTDSSGDNDDSANEINADVSHNDSYYEFVWEETDSSNGVITVSECMTASAEEMAEIGLSGSLVYKANILTYNVSYVKSAEGVYVAEGAIVSAASAVEGESAAAFIQMMKQSLGNSKLDVLTGRTLDGEVLTNKEDIENFIWEFENTVKITFTVQDGEMVVSEYERSYISWGFQAPTKEICYIENAVVRSFNEYERDELVRITYYRENGVIEKTEYYYEGEVSSTEHYDENGDMIEDAG